MNQVRKNNSIYLQVKRITVQFIVGINNSGIKQKSYKGGPPSTVFPCTAGIQQKWDQTLWRTCQNSYKDDNYEQYICIEIMFV